MNYTPNLRAFLETIAISEIGHALLAISDNGYNVCVGSTFQRPILFSDYSKHPRIRDARLRSDAAGRYQFMGRYWEHYRDLLQLPDFGPESQDRWAVRLIQEQDALADIAQGRFNVAIEKCCNIWASFPNAGYNQREHKLPILRMAYLDAGGSISEA